MYDIMILAVFRSRAQSLDFAERLKNYGIPSVTVSAPKEVKIGCGLCVKFEERVFLRAQAIMKTGNYSSFKGFYKMEISGSRMQIFPYHRTFSS